MRGPIGPDDSEYKIMIFDLYVSGESSAMYARNYKVYKVSM